MKVVSSESEVNNAQIKDCLQVKTVKHILLDFEVTRQQMMVFSQKEVLCIIAFGLESTV